MMEINNEMMREALTSAGLPALLLESVESEITDEVAKGNYMAAAQAMEGSPVLFVFGPDSPDKDVICAKLMRRYMFKFKRSGRWVKLTEIDYDSLPTFLGVTVITGMDLLTPLQVKLLSQKIRDGLQEGKAFILSISSEKALNGVFGGEFMNYLSHNSVVLNHNVNRGRMVRIG